MPEFSQYFTVAGGSGGGVLSDRLTEDGQHTVLLLEAGVDDQTPIGQQVHVPINYVPNFKTDADWEYYTEPQKNSCFAMKDGVRCSCFHIFIIYFPRTKLREGNVFSCFCLSVHRGGPKVRGAHPAGMLPCYLIF